MTTDDFLSQFRPDSVASIAVLVACALILLLLLNLRRIQTRLREWRIQRNLNRIGCEQIRNLICSDGLEGYYHIDRLALVQDAILLIAYKPYSGNIYCAERIAEWTQVIGQQSFKFTNPLFELENQLISLKSLAGSTRLRGYLFFNNAAEFPKGHPNGVLHSNNLPDSFVNVDSQTVNNEIRAAWELLKTHQGQVFVNDQLGVKT
jgi:hypothetical protein